MSVLISHKKKIHFLNKICSGTFAYEAELLENGPPNGYMILVDMEGFLLKHMLHFNPSILFQLMFFLQEAYQVRVVKFQRNFFFLNF